jgi:16S rRNA (uracil1498-N3)-methyltransferase
VALGGDDARKLLVVLRKRSGDAIEVCDSSGRAYAAALRVDGERAFARLDAEIAGVRPPSLELVLAQGVPKGAKMDYVIEKATELGVARVVPFVSERTQGSSGERAGKVERWRRVAKAAAQQCGRRDVPEVEAPLSWDELCGRLAEVDRALVPWELAPGEPLRDRLPAALAGARSVLVAIGPEGGLSHAEVDRAVAAGALTVSLGSRILRTETAGLVACAAVLYASGDL